MYFNIFVTFLPTSFHVIRTQLLTFAYSNTLNKVVLHSSEFEIVNMHSRISQNVTWGVLSYQVAVETTFTTHTHTHIQQKTGKLSLVLQPVIIKILINKKFGSLLIKYGMEQFSPMYSTDPMTQRYDGFGTILRWINDDRSLSIGHTCRDPPILIS